MTGSIWKVLSKDDKNFVFRKISNEEVLASAIKKYKILETSPIYKRESEWNILTYDRLTKTTTEGSTEDRKQETDHI